MDERRDPWLATTAALRKLKENYGELGDWNLALAAYNCGLDATLRIRKKAGTNDYWEICEQGYFKKETKNYVPQFLAIATILSRSKEYGIDWGDASTNPTLVTLDVKRPVDINVLAKETGIDAADLKKVNPALFYHITPPDVRYGLRIPADRQGRYRDRAFRQEQDAPRVLHVQGQVGRHALRAREALRHQRST